MAATRSARSDRGVTRSEPLLAPGQQRLRRLRHVPRPAVARRGAATAACSRSSCRRAAARGHAGGVPDSAYGVPTVAQHVRQRAGRGHRRQPRPPARTTSRTRRSAGPATAAPTTSAWRRSRPRPSATRTSSTSATTTRSTATPAVSAAARRPLARATTTTPARQAEAKKDIMAIMAAHRVPYAATLSLAHRDDFMRKLAVAQTTRGFRFLLLLSPCPAGWKSEPADTVELVPRSPSPAASSRSTRCSTAAATASTHAPTARRWRTTSRCRSGSPGRALDVEACAQVSGTVGRGSRRWPPTSRPPTSRSAATRPTAGCACSWRTGRPCWRASPRRSRAAASTSRRWSSARLPDRAHTYITLGVDADERTAERVAKGIARLDAVVDVEPFVGECPEPERVGGATRLDRPATVR